MGIIEDAIKNQVQIVDNPKYPVLDQSKMEAFQKETAHQGLYDVSPDMYPTGLAAMTRPLITNMAKTAMQVPQRIRVLPDEYKDSKLMQGLVSLANMRQ